MMCLFKKIDTSDESPPPATKSVRSVVFGKMRARNVAVVTQHGSAIFPTWIILWKPRKQLVCLDLEWFSLGQGPGFTLACVCGGDDGMRCDTLIPPLVLMHFRCHPWWS